MVVIAYPHQPPQQHGYVGAEDSPVNVRFIDYDEFEVLQKTAPFVVPGQVLVESIGVG